MMPILVIAPSFKYALEWAKTSGLTDTEWNYLTNYRKILSVENVRFHIIYGDNWTSEMLRVREHARLRVLFGRATSNENITNIDENLL